MAGITVIDVFKSLGLEPVPELTWVVGAAVREKYRERHGELPDKELRGKTNGGGSHCFAVYPAEWRGEIEAAIRAVKAEKSAQMDLFGGK